MLHLTFSFLLLFSPLCHALLDKKQCVDDIGFCTYNGVDPKELLREFPNLFEDDTTQENPKILCPFMRTMERYGFLDSNGSILDMVAGSVPVLGWSFPVAGASIGVSFSQLSNEATEPGFVDLEALHLATGIAHECAYTWAKGESIITDSTRNRTISLLAEKANDDGHLTYTDLADMYYKICGEQNVEFTIVGLSEVNMMFTFLAGGDRGYVEHSDIVRFLNAQLPYNLGASIPFYRFIHYFS